MRKTMKDYREDRYLVRSYEVDIRKRLRISGMLDYFQESAWLHAESLDVGARRLDEEGFFWALSRLKVVVERYPVWNEEIVVRTWPKGIDKLLALRDFLVLDGSSRVCVRASSAWIIIHKERRRPVRIEPFFSQVPPSEEREALSGTAEKIGPLFEGKPAGRFTAGYSILDMNRHVNNARYADWVTDSFPLERFEAASIREFSINFLAEVGPETKLDILMASTGDETFFLSGSSGAGEHFRSRVDWSSSIR